MWDEYREKIKSDVADFRNLGKGKAGEAGAITGALFIGSFVESTPWAHLDIAGTAFISENREYTPQGGTGWGVRLLIQLLSDWKKR
jgi:leucyl aminopeptidase